MSLSQHYRCDFITATSYDGKDELLLKYPKVQATLDAFESDRRSGEDPLDEEPTKQDAVESPITDEKEQQQQQQEEEEEETEEWAGFSPNSPSHPHPRQPDQNPNHSSSNEPKINISSQRRILLHSISARALSTSKLLRQRSPFTKIVFNFPHVGGVTKDVNRQVRLNQDLLVSFFKSAKPLLSSPRNPAPRPPKTEYYNSSDDEETDDFQENGNNIDRVGKVLLTVFEGEPYSLWNVRDLARYSGYRVVESMRFDWAWFPGYRHARTLGDVKGRAREEGKREGAWRGEEREARLYVFEVADWGVGGERTKSRKRGKGSDSDSE